MQAELSRIKGFLPILTKFASGQLLLQLLNALNGFLLLRWLSVEQQALFSIAFGLQTLLIGICDMGFSSSIVALVGNKYNDKLEVQKYIKTALGLRNKFFIAGILICFIIYPIVIANQSWNDYRFWINILPIVGAAYWQANCSIYSAPLIINKNMGKFYLPQIISSALRLAVNFILFASQAISSFTALVINALVLFINGASFKKEYVNFYSSASVELEKENKKEMLKYLAPLFPGLIFNVLYGQLQIFIISFFGQTSNIAEVAALGRLSQLFLLLGSLNSLIVGPYIAKSENKSLPRKYYFFLLIALLVATFLILTAFANPRIYLFILGKNYYHLTHELPYMIVAASIGFISGVIWIMNSSRKWIYWWGSWTYIAGISLCQIFGIVFLDVSSTRGVIMLNVITSLFVLLVHLATAFVGFRKERKNI